jgi:diacylglycerol kinase (ATP)
MLCFSTPYELNIALRSPISEPHLCDRPEDIPACRGPWRVGVLSNPLSGANRRRGLGAIHRILQDYPEVPHKIVRSPTDVQAALEDFCGRDLNLIVINSGDGTIQAALTVLKGQRRFAAPPLLALLNGGTTNMTHQDLGLSGPPAAALQRVMNWSYHGEGPAMIRRRTVLKVQNGACARPLYGLFFGSACIFNGIRFFHSRVRRTGLYGDAAHLLIMVRFMWALARRDDRLVAPLSASILADRLAVASRSYSLLLVTTLDRLIMGLRPFQKQGIGPLKLTAVGARPRHLLRALPFLVLGRRSSSAQPENGCISSNASAFRLDMTGGFAVDGELYCADARSGPVLIEDGGPADFLRL